jgi:hypothetical protein
MAYHNQHLSQELPPIHHFTDQTNNNTFRSILPEDSPDDPNSKPDSDPNQLQTTPNWLNNALLRSTHYTDNNNNHNEVNNDVNGNGNGNDASNFLNLQTATDSAAVQTSGQWLSRSILHRHHGEVIDDVSAAVTGGDSVHELGDLKGEHLGGKGETVVGDGGGGLVNWQMGRWKAEIMAHPLYEQLLSAHVACLRIATPVDQLPRIDAQLAQSQNVVAKYSAFGQNIVGVDDKELDHFMVYFFFLLFSHLKSLTFISFFFFLKLLPKNSIKI